MFLVRATFWMAVVMALLPDQRDAFLARLPLLQQEAQERGVDRWLKQSADRAEDLVALCRKQPVLCQDAESAWQGAWRQASDKVQKVLDQFGGESEGTRPLRRRGENGGTLSPTDLEPDWHVATGRSKA